MEEVGLLEPNTFYHLYTRGINGETIFRTKENYFHFLELFKKYALPYLNMYAYCLLPNHVHFLIGTKGEEALQWQSAAGNSNKQIEIHRQLGHLLNAYTKAFNKRFDRKDSLFQKRFRRREVKEQDYFTRLIFYIHFNPQHHGLIKDFRSWPYSSYHGHLSSSKTALQRDNVLEWFGGKNDYIYFHESLSEEHTKNLQQFIIEEDL